MGMSGLSGLSGLSAMFGGVTYLLRDQFTTNASAPLSSPRTCEPGPGTLTIVDTNNISSISGGQLVDNGTPVVNNCIASASAFARQAGRAFLLSVPTRTTLSIGGQWRAGFATANNDSVFAIGFDYSSVNAVRVKDGVTAITTDTIGASQNDFACVMRGTGGFVLARNGTSGPYTLLWVYNSETGALYAKRAHANANAVHIISDDWRVLDLGGAWASDYGIATDRKATTAANDTITQAADAIIEHTVTAATGITQELMVRRTDDDNCWIVRMDQAGSTIKLIEKNASVETERNSAAQTWTNGTQYRVVVTCEGVTIKTFVANVAKNTYSSASFNQSATGVKVSRAGTELIAWPRTVSVPNV